MATLSLEVSRLYLILDYVYKNTLTDSTEVKLDSEYEILDELTTGTEATKADRFFISQSRTLIDAAYEDIDLYDFSATDIGNGTGKDPLGQQQTNAEVVMLLVKNHSDSTGDVVVGGKSTVQAWNSPFNGSDSSTLVVKPDGFVILYGASDPAYAVANTTNHVLKIAASGGAVTYDIVVVARSA